MFGKRHLTAIMPALNEEQAIGGVLQELKALKDIHSGRYLVDEIVVCDNGSTDATAQVALEHGARVIYEPCCGYGAACLAAMRTMRPDTEIVVFVDADQSVKIDELPALLEPLATGADLVIGARDSNLTQSGALTVPQRFGNLLASFLIRLLWQTPVTDLGPFRAITSSALASLEMEDRRYGWTVEMQVKAIQHDLDMVEVPVSSLRRVGQSKISGTIKGVIGAGYGILSKIFSLYRRQRTAENLTRARI